MTITVRVDGYRDNCQNKRCMTITVRVDGYSDNCQNKRCMTITDSKSKWIQL